jgi:hypothetical protein
VGHEALQHITLKVRPEAISKRNKFALGKTQFQASDPIKGMEYTGRSFDCAPFLENRANVVSTSTEGAVGVRTKQSLEHIKKRVDRKVEQHGRQRAPLQNATEDLEKKHIAFREFTVGETPRVKGLHRVDELLGSANVHKDRKDPAVNHAGKGVSEVKQR